MKTDPEFLRKHFLPMSSAEAEALAILMTLEQSRQFPESILKSLFGQVELQSQAFLPAAEWEALSGSRDVAAWRAAVAAHFDRRRAADKHPPVVVVDPEIMAGTPCLAGSRLPASTVLACLEKDEWSRIVESWPWLTPAHADAVREYFHAEMGCTMKLLDEVITVVMQPGSDIQVGQRGTIVDMLQGDPVLVEFQDDEGYTLEVEPWPLQALRRAES
ncbi:DUF433 domain-containing protein [Paucibacter soli]|uniref:DUF433 domain-containing protein n=1 Tax=Paucibacter soli TaxID=3133433 RepID=UPI0030B5A739